MIVELLIFLIFILILIILILSAKIKTLYQKIQELQTNRDIYEIPQIKSPQSFETILKSITDGLLIINPKGYIMLANQSFRDILKIDESPEGKQVIEVVRNIDLINLISSVMSKKQDLAEEIEIKKSRKGYLYSC